jgi:hypothetical protein
MPAGDVCVLGVAALIRHLKREMFMGCNLFRPAVAKIALALFSAARSHFIALRARCFYTFLLYRWPPLP